MIACLRARSRLGVLIVLSATCFLAIGAVEAAPQETSLIVNGDFKALDANGRPAGWNLSESGVGSVSVVAEEDGVALSLKATEPGWMTARQELALDPSWGVLRFAYQVKVKAVTPGKEGWHDARIALTFYARDNKTTDMVAGFWKEPTAGWIDVEQNIQIPVGAAKVKIAPSLFAAVGEWELRNLRVELAAKRGDGVDAKVPDGQSVTWGQEPVEEQTAQRAVVCLNGLWRFQPALGPAADAPQSTGWGWLRVPGSWRGTNLPVVTAATGPAWEGFKGDTAPAAWYERDLAIPATWAGRKVVLDIRRVSTDASVFIDNREIGRVSWPGGEVDLTASVQPGKTHRLRIKVVAVADQAEVTRFMGMGEGQILTEKVVLSSRGLIGDVLLASRPRGAFLTGCAIRTTVKPAPRPLSVDDPAAPPAVQGDTLTVLADYQDLPAAGELALTAVVRDGAGTEVKRFTATAQAAAGTGTVQAAWPWPDPQLWDIGKPNLYTLELSARGAGIDDAIRETFGFREFRIDGKRFLLNGTEIRLRPAPIRNEYFVSGVRELTGDALDGLRWAGYNIHELWPWNRDERGTWEFDSLYCEEADRRGFLLIAPTLDMGPLAADWDKPGVADAWNSRMSLAMKRLLNHPSVVMWVTGTNRFGHGQDQNPEAIGNHDRAWIDLPGWRHTAESGMDAIRRIKTVDPTRPVYMHAGGPVGDVYTANNYLCLIPLQEREEWPSQWAASGDMPVLMVEFGTPLYVTLHRGRQGYGHAATSEPLYSEICAIYQGSEAYRLESAAYRDALANTYDKDQLWKTWHPTYPVEIQRIHEGFNRLEALFLRNTWRTWRTWGVTGGMLPWEDGHGWQLDGNGGNYAKATAKDRLAPFVPGQRGTWLSEAPRGRTRYLRPDGMPMTVAGEALVAANQETLAWIAGAPDFVDKTHHVRAGASLTKQAAIINDGRVGASWSLSWTAELNGKALAAGTMTGKLAPAGITFSPIDVAIPETLSADRVPGMIRMTCSIGGARHEDAFPFTAFRPTSPTTTTTVAVLDPVGDTTALLKSLGVTTAPWDGVATDRLLVVGRNALAKGGTDLAAIEPLLRAGGHALLMAQDPDWMRDRLGLRVARQLTRRGFPVMADHPALGGLDAEALRDWAGASTLVNPIEAALQDVHPYRCPTYGWRWGSRHAISSAAIEVPHRAGWRPLISCEFDSAYTPLAEVAIGSGMLTLCMLDLEDHAIQDPAAERIARSVLAYAATARPEPRAPAAYLGGPDGAALLATSGILHQKTGSLPESGLAVIGADATVDDAALDTFLKKGGKVLILPRHTETAPFGVKLAHVEKHAGSLAIPAWPSCQGLLPSELRRRTDGEAWVVSSGADAVDADGLLAEIRRGDGVAVFFQPNVAALDADRLCYNRLTRWRWTRALAQIAANLGAECEGDSRLFKLIPPPDIVPLDGTWKATLTIPLPSISADSRHKDPGISDRAKSLIAKDADEQEMQDVPISKEWENYGKAWAKADGEAVFRRAVDIPAHWSDKDLLLSLGAIDDFDATFFDGQPVGATDIKVPNFWSAPRLYTVPGNMVTPGRHVIAVRVFDHFGGGGMVGQPGQLALTPKVPLTPSLPSFYHPDWRTDFPLGDDPSRYVRW